MDNMKHRRLQELDRSDFEIVDGEPDIRGWDVKNTAGRKIGEVEELIVDARQKKVRYMVVDLDDNELKVDHKKVLIPIGMAELHQDDDDVIIPSVNEQHLNALPDYDEGNLVGTAYSITDYTRLPYAVNQMIADKYKGYTIETVQREMHKNQVAYEVKLKGVDDSKIKLLVDQRKVKM